MLSKISKMIITISGLLGTESRIIGRMVGMKLKMPHHSTGRYVRNLAERKDIPLENFTKMAESDISIDHEIDHMIAEHGRKSDNFVLDARAAFHFIPQSIKVLLKADFDTRVRRNYKYDIRTELNVTMDKTAERIRSIDESDIKRFKHRYSIDIMDEGNFDLVIDNTDLTLEETADRIVNFVKENTLKTA